MITLLEAIIRFLIMKTWNKQLILVNPLYFDHFYKFRFLSSILLWTILNKEKFVSSKLRTISKKAFSLNFFRSTYLIKILFKLISSWKGSALTKNSCYMLSKHILLKSKLSISSCTAFFSMPELEISLKMLKFLSRILHIFLNNVFLMLPLLQLLDF